MPFYQLLSLSMLIGMASRTKELTDPFSNLLIYISENNIEALKAHFDPAKHLRKCDNGGLSLLHHAAKARSLECVLFLLEKNVPINACDENNQTPLHYAASWQDDSLVQVLLDSGADMEILDSERCTALHRAADCGAHRCVSALISKGATYACLNEKGFTPLDCAICYGYTAVVQEFIRLGIAPQNGMSKSQPVHLAAVLGDIQLLHSLQAAGANLMDELSLGIAAFNIAIFANQIQFVQELLATGNFDVNQRDNHFLDNYTPVEIVIARGYWQMLIVFLDYKADLLGSGNGCGNSLLHSAAKYKQKECVEILLKAGADANACNSSDETPLIIAIEENSPECVEALIKGGANILQGDNGAPLCHAAFIGNTTTIDLLLRNGAQPSWLDQNRKNALCRAIEGRCKKGKKLAERESTDCKDPQVNAEAGSPLLPLLRGWAQPGLPCTEGNLTPFHVAILRNELTSLRELIAHSHLLLYEDNPVQVRESQERLRTSLLCLKGIYDSKLKEHSATPNTKDLAAMTLLQSPLLFDILTVFFHEMRYGNISKSLLLLSAKDFVLDYLTQQIQEVIKMFEEECLQYRVKRAKTGLFRSGFIRDTAPEISDQTRDLIDTIATKYEYTRNLIKEVIDYYINNPVMGIHHRANNSSSSHT